MGALGPLFFRPLPTHTTMLSLWLLIEPVVWGALYLSVPSSPDRFRLMKLVEGGVWIGLSVVLGESGSAGVRVGARARTRARHRPRLIPPLRPLPQPWRFSTNAVCSSGRTACVCRPSA